MSRIIRPRTYETRTTFERHYRYVDDPGAGFIFRVDEDGDLLPEAPPEARANFEACLTGHVHGQEVYGGAPYARVKEVAIPAVMRCDCGAQITLDHGWLDSHECRRCHRLYNGSGQALRPMHEWGEDTGERLSDLIGAGDDQ